MGPFIWKEENITPTPAWPAAHIGFLAQCHSHHHPSSPLLPTKRCPEASLHPTNLPGHEEADKGCEQGQVGGHGWTWLSQLSENGPQLEQLCQHSPHWAMPNSRQNPSTRPPLPKCLEYGLGEPSMIPKPVPGLLGSCGIIPST